MTTESPMGTEQVPEIRQNFEDFDPSNIPALSGWISSPEESGLWDFWLQSGNEGQNPDFEGLRVINRTGPYEVEKRVEVEFPNRGSSVLKIEKVTHFSLNQGDQKIPRQSIKFYSEDQSLEVYSTGLAILRGPQASAMLSPNRQQS